MVVKKFAQFRILLNMICVRISNGQPNALFIPSHVKGHTCGGFPGANSNCVGIVVSQFLTIMYESLKDVSKFFLNLPNTT